jgi:hypothetical protein
MSEGGQDHGTKEWVNETKMLHIYVCISLDKIMQLICLAPLWKLQTHILIVEEGNVMGEQLVNAHTKGWLEGLCSCPSWDGRYVQRAEYTGAMKDAVPFIAPGVTLYYPAFHPYGWWQITIVIFLCIFPQVISSTCSRSPQWLYSGLF